MRPFRGWAIHNAAALSLLLASAAVAAVVARGEATAPLPDALAPGGPAAVAPPAPPPRPPPPQFRLVGLVALAGGKGIAAIQVSGASPRVVNVGDSVSGFRLVAVSPTGATLRGVDTTLVIRSSPPAP